MIFWSYESFPFFGFAGTMPTAILTQGLYFKRNKLFAILIELNGLLLFQVVKICAEKQIFILYSNQQGLKGILKGF